MKSKTILRLPQVKIRTGRGRSAIYAGMEDGSFPQSIKIGQRAIGWLENEVDAWVEKQIKKSRKAAGR